MRIRTASLRVVAAAVWLSLLATALWIAPVDGDDAYAHSVMAVEQLKCWRHGVMWPRFHPDWNGGTGSFLPSVYAPLTLTAEGVACWLTGEGSRAVSLVLLGGLLGGALLLWSALRTRGIDGGVGWLVAAYPLAAVLARATTTETMALAFAAPALVLALPPGPRSARQGLALGAAVALTAGCQVGMVLMTGLVLVAAWSISAHAWRKGLLTAAWFGSGALAGGLFWWPTVHDISWMARDLLARGEYDWRTHHVFSLASNEELGLFLVACFFAVVLAGLAIAWSARGRRELRPLLAAVAWALVLATPLSFPLWSAARFMAGLQFPWRFLGPATVLCLAGAAMAGKAARRVVPVLLAVPALLIPVELAFPTPPLTPDLDARQLAEAGAARYGIAAVLPTMPGFFAPGFNGITSLGTLRRQPARVVADGDGFTFPRTFEVHAPAGTRVLLPLEWWPELRVSTAGRPLAFTNRAGLVAVRVAETATTITVALSPSRSRRVGALISAAGVLLLAALYLVSGRPRAGSLLDAR